MSASQRKILDLQAKLRVVELSKTKSCRKIAEEFGVGKTQIQSTVKRRAEVLGDYENNVVLDRKRKRYNGTNDEFNEIMWNWF